MTKKDLVTSQGFDSVKRLTVYRVPCGTSVAGIEVVMNVLNQLESRVDAEIAKPSD